MIAHLPDNPRAALIAPRAAVGVITLARYLALTPAMHPALNVKIYIPARGRHHSADQATIFADVIVQAAPGAPRYAGTGLCRTVGPTSPPLPQGYDRRTAAVAKAIDACGIRLRDPRGTRLFIDGMGEAALALAFDSILRAVGAHTFNLVKLEG